jgi:hypothetical protein
MYSVWFSVSAAVWGLGAETQITDYLSCGWDFTLSNCLFSPLHLKNLCLQCILQFISCAIIAFPGEVNVFGCI